MVSLLRIWTSFSKKFFLSPVFIYLWTVYQFPQKRLLFYTFLPSFWDTRLSFSEKKIFFFWLTSITDLFFRAVWCIYIYIYIRTLEVFQLQMIIKFFCFFAALRISYLLQCLLYKAFPTRFKFALPVCI